MQWLETYGVSPLSTKLLILMRLRTMRIGCASASSSYMTASWFRPTNLPFSRMGVYVSTDCILLENSNSECDFQPWMLLVQVINTSLSQNPMVSPYQRGTGGPRRGTPPAA